MSKVYQVKKATAATAAYQETWVLKASQVTGVSVVLKVSWVTWVHRAAEVNRV